MAAAYLPAPGTEFGPCEEECEHTDCAAVRRNATAPCTICTEPIGYETGHFLTDNRLSSGRTYSHSRCAAIRWDAKRQASSLPVFEGLMRDTFG